MALKTHDMELVHKGLSYRILGALFAVFNEIGAGHKEHVYQRAVAAALTAHHIPFVEQVKTELIAFGQPLGKYYLDFLIDGVIILEIKSRAHFRSADYRQAKMYLHTTKLPLAILATFSDDGVRHKRVVNFFDHI